VADEDLIRVARENIDAFGAGDWERVRVTMTEDSIYQEYATGRRVQGAENVLQADQGWKKAFPDAKGTVNSAIASGDKVTMEVTWSGTQTGPLEGAAGVLPPSGKSVTVNAALVLSFQGDRIKEAHHYFDMLGMLQQLGAVPAGAGA
jgi:steroid delta-isomerase-like uncharacterized protein